MPTSNNAGMDTDTISGMDYIERVARCLIRATHQTGTWNGTLTVALYRTWMAWFWYPMWELLHPFVEPPPGMPPRRAICSNGQYIDVPVMLNDLGSDLGVGRNTGESDFDYSGRLLAA